MKAINPSLAQLETAGLVRVAALQPEIEYLFRHALVQDAAYASLLKTDRKRLHEAVGLILQQTYPDRLEELAPLLAQHFHEAGDTARALHYYTLAGDSAYQQYANAEAISHYGAALELARQVGNAGPALVHLYTRRGRALELQGDYDGALANYEAMAALAAARADQPLELASVLATAAIRVMETPHYEPTVGQALCDRALSLARELGDRAAEAQTLWCLCLLCRATGRLDEAIGYGEQSVAIARALDLREQMAQTLNDLAYHYAGRDRHAEGFAALEEAGQLWRELGNLPMLADNRTTTGMRHYLAGDLPAALLLVQEGYAIYQRVGNGWGQAFAHAMEGMISYVRGDVDAAIAHYEETIQLAEQTGFMAGQAVTGAYLTAAHTARRDLVAARATSARALQIATAQVPVWRPTVLAAQALLAVRAGDLAAAEAALATAHTGVQPGDPFTYQLLVLAEGERGLARGDHSRLVGLMDDLLAALRERGIAVYGAHALYYQGRALQALGRQDAARGRLTQARVAAEATGATGVLPRILAALDEFAAPESA